MPRDDTKRIEEVKEEDKEIEEQIAEVEINLAYLNRKLNIIINELDNIKKIITKD